MPSPDTMLSLILLYYWQKNLPVDSDVRQWSHPLMIPLYCLWVKPYNIMCGQFECGGTWFCFCFDFVRSHARCGCSIVCLRCQVVQIKQVDFKVSNYRYKTFLVIVGQLPKEYSQEKAVSAASAKWKEVKGKPVVINLINL